MRAFSRSVIVSAGLLAAVGLVPRLAGAGGTVAVLVLREHGIGGSGAAQGYIDTIMAMAAKENGWTGVKGVYHTSRSSADAFVAAEKPSYGIVSLSAFLYMRGKYGVEPIGVAAPSPQVPGHQQYFVVSTTAGNLAACKGKRLSTEFDDDPRFVENVVFERKVKFADFKEVVHTRPGPASAKKVIGGEAECALIDDSVEPAKLDPALKVVWSSARMPGMPIVAFPSAPAAEKTAFQASLSKICAPNPSACQQSGLASLRSAGPADFAAVVALY